jgi:hypothetical protein
MANLNVSEIKARSTKLGAITRAFKGSLETFSNGLNNEIHTVENAVLSVSGWEGELYDGFRDRFVEELAELKKLSMESTDIANRLERCAVQYDIIIEKLKKAGK